MDNHAAYFKTVSYYNIDQLSMIELLNLKANNAGYIEQAFQTRLSTCNEYYHYLLWAY